MTPDQIRRRDWVATYPSREQALALIEWFKSDDWSSVYYDLDRRLAGIGIKWTDSFLAAAERCWEVYGYPELEPVARARRVAEVTTRPALSAPRVGVARGSDDLPGPSAPTAPSARSGGPQTMTYGFSPQR